MHGGRELLLQIGIAAVGFEGNDGEALQAGVVTDQHLATFQLTQHLSHLIRQRILQISVIGPLAADKLFDQPLQRSRAELVVRNFH